MPANTSYHQKMVGTTTEEVAVVVVEEEEEATGIMVVRIQIF
jgi:hypothetical protein